MSHDPAPGALGLTEALAAVDRARTVIAGEAAKADVTAAFPAGSIAALRDGWLMSAGIPRAYGGHGFDARQLSELAMRLGALCGSTAMIWAMHQIQLACLENSATEQPEVADYLRQAAREQLLIASMTSEEGTGGSLRTSKTAVRPVAAGVEISKRASTVSYADHADGFLVTARRGQDAGAGDQVLVLVHASQAEMQLRRLAHTGDARHLQWPASADRSSRTLAGARRAVRGNSVASHGSALAPALVSRLVGHCR